MSINARHCHPFVLFSILFMSTFAITYLAFSDLNKGDNSGYLNMVENVSLPILLSENREQYNLHISSLIQNTPIHQVRIYDNTDKLLFRVQNNSAKPDKTEILGGLLDLDNNLIGRIEVELIDASANKQGRILRSVGIAMIATLLAFIAHRVLSAPARTETLVANTAEAANTIDSTEALAEDEEQTEIASASEAYRINTSPGLLIIVRALKGQSLEDRSVELTLDEIAKIANLYGLSIVGRSRQGLALHLKGAADAQICLTSVMFSWGVMRLCEERQSNEQGLAMLQAHIFDNSQLSYTNPDTDIWSEVEPLLAPQSTHGLFISSPLSKLLEPSMFDVTMGAGDLHEVTNVSDSVKRLWSNQRSLTKTAATQAS